MKTTRRTTEQVIRILPDQMLKSKVLELALEKTSEPGAAAGAVYGTVAEGCPVLPLLGLRL